tara:strand:+ start:148 stop:312 length:165 start_codon:yes stop_codon:yes gene_type:complete
MIPFFQFALAANQMGFESGLVWLGGLFAVIFVIVVSGSRIPLLRRWFGLSKKTS